VTTGGDAAWLDNLVCLELLWLTLMPWFSNNQTPLTSHHLSCALAVTQIILLIGALVRTLVVCTVLSAYIISHCWVHLPFFLWVWFLLHLQVCLLSLVWVSTLLFTEFACHFVYLRTGWLYATWFFTLLVISLVVCLSTNLWPQLSSGQCTAWCFLLAFPVLWLLVGRVVFDCSTVISLLYVIAALTTNLLLLCIPELLRLSRDSFGIVAWTWGFSIQL